MVGERLPLRRGRDSNWGDLHVRSLSPLGAWLARKPTKAAEPANPSKRLRSTGDYTAAVAVRHRWDIGARRPRGRGGFQSGAGSGPRGSAFRADPHER